MMALISRYRLLGTAAVLLAAFFAGWLANGWRLGGQMADMRAEWSDTLRKTAETNAAVILKQQQDRQALESQLAAIDEQRYGELRNAQENTDRLAGELAAARSRLRVRIDPASCPAVSATASAASVDNGGIYAELYGETAAALVRITGDADACAVKLKALQEWARGVTSRSALPANP